jgi:hypothetical protein
MGRIVANLKIENVLEKKSVEFTGLIDSGASHVVLPNAWRDRFGPLEEVRRVNLSLANQESVTGTVCGPVRITLEGFGPVFSELIFVDMQKDNGDYEPIIGYILLEQCQAAIDFLGHRLIPVKPLDLKQASLAA